LELLIKQLDLTEHFEALSSRFARPKAVALEGDTETHISYMRELESVELPPLPNARSLTSAIARLNKQGIAKLDEIYDFVRIARLFERLKITLKEGRCANWVRSIEIHPRLNALSAVFDDQGGIKREASEELARVQEAIDAKRKQAKTALARLVSDSKLAPYLVDQQTHIARGEETLLLRGGFNHVLSGRVVDRTAAGFFYVYPRSAMEIAQAIEDLSNEKERVIAALERDYSASLYAHTKFLRFLDAAFDRFDHYQARLAFAKDNNLAIVAPKSQRRIVLDSFCHPAISNPTSISIDFSKPIMLITGVNAGGKTMLLKSVLSAALMAKLLVPMRINPHRSHIGRFKQIEAVIADPQNAKNDISTFAGRMRQFAPLFGKSDLLLGIDEIELGTDSDEAASLFRVLLVKLADRGFHTLVTTHHKRLAALMAKDDRVELAAALYDEARQKPTYGFMQGSIGRSYAFETALRYGVPHFVVSEATRAHGEDKERLNDLIERSSELERQMRQKIAALDSEMDKTARQQTLLAEAREQQEELFREKISKLEREFNEAIAKAKMAIKATSQSDLHRAINEANAIKAKIELPKPEERAQTLQAGDHVKYQNSVGVIRSIGAQNAVVEIEGKRLVAPLALLKRSRAPLAKKQASIVYEKPLAAHVSLDLHGLRATEALEKLDKFLSDALIAGFDEVIIVHGVGSGKLAYAVREALKAYPKALEFFDAPPNMGGMGATIVRL
jgi:DNA mismatch repair protein MutS2